MYQNFEGLEPGEDIKNFKFFWVSPNPLGVQGLPFGFDLMYLAQADRNMQVRFSLKVF